MDRETASEAAAFYGRRISAFAGHSNIFVVAEDCLLSLSLSLSVCSCALVCACMFACQCPVSAISVILLVLVVSGELLQFLLQLLSLSAVPYSPYPKTAAE